MNADLGNYATGELGDYSFEGLLSGDLGDYSVGELGEYGEGGGVVFKQVQILANYAALPAASAFRDPLDNNDFIVAGDTSFYDSTFNLDGFGIPTAYVEPGTYVFSMYFSDGAATSPVAQVTLTIVDNVPDAFPITVTDVPVNTLIKPEVVISGVEDGSTLYLTAGAGELSMDGAVWGTTPVEVNLGATRMRYLITSSASLGQQVTQSVTINGVTSLGSALTSGFVIDPFSFPGVTGAELSTLTESTAQVIGGSFVDEVIDGGGAEYSIDGAAYVTAAGTISAGQSVKMRVLSSAIYSTSVSVSLSIGTESASFTVITISDPDAEASGRGLISLRLGLGL